jgi:hypothetical protein
VHEDGTQEEAPVSTTITDANKDGHAHEYGLDRDEQDKAEL